MNRDLLNDEQWKRIAPLLPGKKGDPGRSGKDNRLFLEAVLWLVRAGAPWRDLPPRFGKWGSVWKRFRRWAKKGVFERIFNALSEDETEITYQSEVSIVGKLATFGDRILKAKAKEVGKEFADAVKKRLE